MDYKLVKSENNDLKKIIDYKKQIIYEFSKNLTKKEINKINNYVTKEVRDQFNNCYSIVVNNKKVGCLLVTEKDDGKLIDEIYLEEEYRNKGIGTNIIKNIIRDNIVYLWVYKLNIKAIALYKRLGFKIVNETETRYYMRYYSIK